VAREGQVVAAVLPAIEEAEDLAGELAYFPGVVLRQRLRAGVAMQCRIELGVFLAQVFDDQRARLAAAGGRPASRCRAGVLRRAGGASARAGRAGYR
jgi:hypothetical protein